ncbi:MAG TPA: hypothetical protein VMX75_07760 [Spirochaetia bacterium]|nr:hypothetical protein [Spirochaetia bacterium]
MLKVGQYQPPSFIIEMVTLETTRGITLSRYAEDAMMKSNQRIRRGIGHGNIGVVLSKIRKVGYGCTRSENRIFKKMW